MADDILKNSLSGLSSEPLPATPKGMLAPNATGNNDKDIAALKGAQQNPSDMLNLQKALQVGSKKSYDQRQASEMEMASGQFDPTKVSGGTFAGIIGNLEQRRGMDIGKVYASTMSTYAQVQNTITQRLQFLEDLEMRKDQFKEDMKMREKEYHRLKENDEQAAKEFKKEMEESTRRWELDYAESKRKATQSNDVDVTNLTNDLFNQINPGGTPSVPQSVNSRDDIYRAETYGTGSGSNPSIDWS